MAEIPLPVEGIEDLYGPDRQRKGTTRLALNVGEIDPIDLTGGVIAQRGGQVKHTASALSAGTKVSLLCDVVYDNPTHTYANLASAACTVDWSSVGENRSEALNIVRDTLGNKFYVDGAASIVKVNASGRKDWNLPLPAVEPGSIVRALCVDDAGRIFAATSAGADPDKARIWCFEQIEERKKPELLWTLGTDEEPLGWFTEELHIDGATLQASQNNPLTRQSRMALYSGLGLATPTEIRAWGIPHPVNGHHFSPKDGSIFTAHQPDALRTHDPRSPQTTGSRQDWTPRDLTNAKDRIWSWVDANDVDGGGLGNDAYEAGDTIDSLNDLWGGGRGFVTNAPDLGPTLRKGGIAGLDSLYFNGTNQSMVSAAGVSTEAQFRQINTNFLPTYKKAQFVCFMVLRLHHEAGQGRIILSQSRTVATAADRHLLQNCVVDTVTTVSAAGNITCVEAFTASGASGPVLGGSSPIPLGGAHDGDGLVLISWIHDGGYDDVVSVPTRSCLRINGRPCDRWTSYAAFENLLGTTLGKGQGGSPFTALARMQGDFCEALVLSDWYTAGFGQSSALAQQRLITTPIYPDAVWAADGDTELEKIEGYLAHKWGLAHKLPTGQWNGLRATATGEVLNNETVTIDARVYTFKTVLTGAADEVQISAVAIPSRAFFTQVSLMHAINGTGTPGTDYTVATTPHASVWSPGVTRITQAAGNTTMFVQRRDPRVFAVFGTTETMADEAWLNVTNSVSSRDGAGLNTGHYPHSFFLFRAMGVTGSGTPLSRGGPPRKTGGVTFPSVVGALISPYGILAKWDPANGKVRNILTTDGPGYAFLGVGGVGFGVRIASDGSVFSVGPRQAAVSGIIASADNVDVRKVWDKGAEDTTAGGWAITNGTTQTTNWVAAPGAQTYAYPRMDVDKWDNVYVPLFGATAQSLAVYAKLGVAGPIADLLLLLADLTDDPRAYAASIDIEYPMFPNAYVKPRAERVLLGTERVTSASNFLTLHMVRIVSATLSNLPPRAQKVFAACGAGLYDITVPATPALVDAAAFSASARLITWCEAFGKLFFADGDLYRTYDPFTGALSYWRSRSSGELPKRGQFVERGGNRIYLGGFKDEPGRVVASTAGDPYGWNFDPPGEAPLATSAWTSGNSPSGDFPDIVTGIKSARDDLTYIGGARNLFLVRGDPLQGGRFDQVTKGVGVAHGRAMTTTPDGRLWWITTEAELYVVPIGAGEGYASLVSAPIAKRLQDAIDFSVCRPELRYDPRTKSLSIFLFPTGAGDTLFRHFRVSLLGQRARFWEDSYGHVNIQPTACHVLDGDASADRKMLYGSRDGYVRAWNAAALGDDGTRVDSKVLLGPLHDQGQGVDATVTDVRILLARAQGGARVDAYATDEPEDLGDPIDGASLLPGRNTPTIRFSGAYTALQVTGETNVDRWSLRRVEADLLLSGPVRARGR